MNITVAGTGYVGLVTGSCFAEVGHYVTCIDLDEKRINMLKQGICPIFEEGLEELINKNYKFNRIDFTTDYKAAYKNSEVIFIGVGTPEQQNGSANLDYLSTVINQIVESVENDCLLVIKSTVPIGTNDKVEQFIKYTLKKNIKINIASNPEFLSQGSAINDTLYAKRIVIGTENKHDEKLLKEIYKPFNLPLVSVKRRSAEMIKLASNAFLALKISYMNDIANLCELAEADIKEVAEGMAYDTRIGSGFLNAGIGYGGSCFPKDTKALLYLAKQNGYELQTVEAAVSVNEKQKYKLLTKANKRLISFAGIKVAILGVTFKPGTDDLREAPSLSNISLLLSQGARIYAYDPIGLNNLREIYSNQITCIDTIEDALIDAQVCFIFTEWDEVKNIQPSTYKSLMKTPLVYDGRNIYDNRKMKEAGIEYYSIGRAYD